MSEIITFPETVEEFMEQYKVVDTEKVYTSGIELVPIFRMKQWFEHLPAVPHEMSAKEYIIIEQRCKSWCVSNGGCESCCYRGFCWVDALEPEAYLWFYTLWAWEHPEEAADER